MDTKYHNILEKRKSSNLKIFLKLEILLSVAFVQQKKKILFEIITENFQLM